MATGSDVAIGVNVMAASTAPTSATQRKRLRAPRCASPSDHSANETATSTPRASATPPASTCCASTHSSQTQVANIGNAMNCLNSSIQRPGRGSFASSAGNSVSSR